MKYFFIILLTFKLVFTYTYADIINDVQVKNNNRITKETIITFGGIKLGSDYSQEQLNNILLDLYSTNFFSDIKFNLQGDTLVVTVQERKIVQKILLNGIKAEKTKKSILKNLSIKEKSPYVNFLAKQDIKKIKNALNSSGYYFNKVDVSIKDNNNETVDLIYNIDLGEKALIKNIIFTGEKFYKDKKLKNVIVSEESKFWKFISNKKYLNPEQINLDLRLLEKFYLNKGFYNVEIKNSSAIFNDNHFNLVYNINSGNIYTIRNTKLILPDDFDEKDFNEVMNVLKDLKEKRYSLNKLNKVVKQIDQISVSRLYDFIDASIEAEIIGDNELDISFVVKESEKFYVKKINVLGNNITEERVIRDLLEVDEGDPFNKLLHAKSLNNIRARNIFQTVKSEVIDTPEQGLKNLNIIVEEKATGEILIGAGVGSEGGTAQFSVSENNFLGKNIKLSTNFRTTEDTLRASFAVTNPNFNYSNKALITSVENTTIDKMADNGYDTTKTGFTIGTRYEQYENTFFSPKFTNYFEDLTTSSKASENLKKQSGNYFESKFSYALDFDKRNKRYQTTDGTRTVLIQGIPLVSDEYAVLNGFESEKWMKFKNDMVTNFGIYGRAINSFNDEDVRVTDRLSLPRNKLKGFAANRIGPVDSDDYVGGNFAAALNFDTTLPMILPSAESMDFKYFIDIGNVWSVDYNDAIDDSNKIRSATGITVDWFTPIGPMNFSLSQDLSKASDDKTETFQFSLGTTF